jgi:hypothetical protein
MIIMDKEINEIDGLEVFVKIKMGISLSEEEMNIYNGYDDDEKKLIFDFINNPVLINDLDRIVEKIKNKEELKKHK